MKIIIYISTVLILIIISNCNLLFSKSPIYRIQNYCDYTADFKVAPAGADTIRIDGVQNNTSGDFKDIKEGNVNVIAIVQGDSELYTNNFVAKDNRKYTITLHDGDVFGEHIIHLEIADEPNL